MKQLGNLAQLCARRPEVLLQIYNGRVAVYVGAGLERKCLQTSLNDIAALRSIIYELNFGAYKQETEAA